MKKNKIAFTKVSGAGNDFLIVDIRSSQKKLSLQKKRSIVRAACNRHFGVGADGMIFLEIPKNKKNNFKWDFYNKDGSHAEMCLNASRCVVRYELQQGKEVSFESVAGTVIGKKSGKDIQVELPIKKQKIQILSVRTSGSKEKQIETDGYFVNSGVPHFVVHKKITNKNLVREISSHLRFHNVFKKPGSNITYWNGKGSTVDAVTFERGVEDFTLACGTGAVAIGMVFDSIYKKNPIIVKMPGGKIKVELKEESALITGPAEIICKGDFYV